MYVFHINRTFTAIISPHSISRSAFSMEKYGVQCEVEKEILYIKATNFILQTVKIIILYVLTCPISSLK